MRYPVGVLAGFYGNRVDTRIMRMMGALLTFSDILLALVVITSLGPSIQNVILAVGILAIPQYARLSRGSVLSIKECYYVEAARATVC